MCVNTTSICALLDFAYHHEGDDLTGPLSLGCAEFAYGGGLDRVTSLELRCVGEVTITRIVRLRLDKQPSRMAWLLQVEMLCLLERWVSGNRDLPTGTCAVAIRLAESYLQLDLIPNDTLRRDDILRSAVISVGHRQRIERLKIIRDNPFEQFFEARRAGPPPSPRAGDMDFHCAGDMAVHCWFREGTNTHNSTAVIEKRTRTIHLINYSSINLETGRIHVVNLNPRLMGNPQGVAFNKNGELFVSNCNWEVGPEVAGVEGREAIYNNFIYVFDYLGTYLRRFPAVSAGPAGPTGPGGLAICPLTGDVLLGTDRVGVSFYTQEGVLLADKRLIPVDGTPIGEEIGIAIDQNGGIVVSSSTGVQTFSCTGHSTTIVFPKAIHRMSSFVGVSPQGDIVIPLEDPVYRSLSVKVNVFSSMGNLLQVIGFKGDSHVTEVVILGGLTVDVRGTVWFSSPNGIFTLGTDGSAPPAHRLCESQEKLDNV